MLWFSVKKNFEKKFSFLCVNKFYDVIKIRKNWLLSKQKNMFWISKKIQKVVSHPFSFSKKDGVLFWIKDEKMKKRVSYSFSLKKYFWVIWKLTKENWHIWNKKELIKKTYHVENDKKKRSFVIKKYLLNKGWSG